MGRSATRDTQPTPARPIDGEPPNPSDLSKEEAVWARLERAMASALDGLPRQAIAAVDLDDFLRTTAAIDVAPWERVRQLAIRAEATCSSPAGWFALRRIYRRALAATNTDAARALVLSSMTISARLCAPVPGASCFDPAVPHASVRDGLGAAEALVALEPHDPENHLLVAEILSYSPRYDDAEALDHYNAALTIDPTHTRALRKKHYCLRQLGRLRDAVAAAEALDRDRSEHGPRPEHDGILESCAYCLAAVGERAAATSGFDRLLRRHEREPPKEAWYSFTDVIWAVERFGLPAELRARAEALAWSGAR